MFEGSGWRGNKAAPAFYPSSPACSVDQLDTAPSMPPTLPPSPCRSVWPRGRTGGKRRRLVTELVWFEDLSRVSNAFCQELVKCQPFCVVHRCVLLRLETPVQTLCTEVFSIRDKTLSGFLLSAPTPGECPLPLRWLS